MRRERRSEERKEKKGYSSFWFTSKLIHEPTDFANTPWSLQTQPLMAARSCQQEHQQRCIPQRVTSLLTHWECAFYGKTRPCISCMLPARSREQGGPRTLEPRRGRRCGILCATLESGALCERRAGAVLERQHRVSAGQRPGQGCRLPGEG